MMDQVCNEIKRVLLAGVGLADKGIQKVGQGVNSLSQHGEEVWQKLTAKQKSDRIRAAQEREQRAKEQRERTERTKKIVTVIVCVILVLALGIPTMALTVLSAG